MKFKVPFFVLVFKKLMINSKLPFEIARKEYKRECRTTLHFPAIKPIPLPKITINCLESPYIVQIGKRRDPFELMAPS